MFGKLKRYFTDPYWALGCDLIKSYPRLMSDEFYIRTLWRMLMGYELDLKNPKTNHKNPGFTDEERGQFTNLLDAGFVDTFRHFYPDTTDVYSWWSYRFQARQKNVGWRIDYFVVSENLRNRLTGAKIHTEIFGSDHCPVELTLE